jgi:type IV pilus assembly protein PilC
MGIKYKHIKSNSELQDKQLKTNIFSKELFVFKKGFSFKKKEAFYEELSVLLHSGINLKRALDLIIEIQKKQKDKTILQSLSSKIIEGNSFSEAMQQISLFTPYEFKAIQIGEQTGKLPEITANLKEYFMRKNELNKQLISSLSYPVIVLFTASLVVFFMLRWVVPMFEDIFKLNKVELPWLTQQIVRISSVIRENGFWFFIIILLSILLLKAISNKYWFYKFKGLSQLKTPVLGEYIKKIYIIQFTQAMALLTQAKIPMVSALSLVREMVHFYPLEKSLLYIEKDIVIGKKLSDSFNKHNLFDSKMIALLKVAEETNQTEYIFKNIFEIYSKEIKHQSQIISTSLNFLLTLVVGIIVGIILIAMYLPMFKLSSVIG